MPFRVVATYPVRLETSVGVVTGELWSDHLLGIGLEAPNGEVVADGDAVVDNARDVGELLAEVGVPQQEAFALAATMWAEELGPRLEAWEDADARRDVDRGLRLIARWRLRRRG